MHECHGQKVPRLNPISCSTRFWDCFSWIYPAASCHGMPTYQLRHRANLKKSRMRLLRPNALLSQVRWYAFHRLFFLMSLGIDALFSHNLSCLVLLSVAI